MRAICAALVALVLTVASHAKSCSCAASKPAANADYPQLTDVSSNSLITPLKSTRAVARSTGTAPDFDDDDLPDAAVEEAEARARLGRATWYLLHTMAAKYPVVPTEDDKQRMRDFFRIFSQVYPCPVCSEHFRGHLTSSPPQVGSREDLSQWLCGVHNTVNRMLNKPEYPCAGVNENYDCGCESIKPVDTPSTHDLASHVVMA